MVKLPVSIWLELVMVKTVARLVAPTATIRKSPAPLITGEPTVIPFPLTVATADVVGARALGASAIAVMA